MFKILESIFKGALWVSIVYTLLQIVDSLDAVHFYLQNLTGEITKLREAVERLEESESSVEETLLQMQEQKAREAGEVSSAHMKGEAQ